MRDDQNPYIPVKERFTFLTNRFQGLNVCDQNGFQYSKTSVVSKKNGEIRWICFRKRQGCKAYIKTVGDFIIAKKNVHTCI